MMTNTQTQAIATACNRVRDDWHHAGILAALRKAAPLGSPAAVAAALFRLADDRTMDTPGLLHQPGPWWGGTTVADRRPPTMCGTHPQRRALECPECASEVAAGDHLAGVRAVKAALREAPRYLDPAVVAARQAEHRRLAAELAELRGEGA